MIPPVYQKLLNTLRQASPRKVATGLLVAVLLVWGVALVSFTIDAAGGADSSGYMNNARLLLEGRIQDDSRMLPEIQENTFNIRGYAPLGFHIDPETQRLIPGYWFGFPLVLAPFQAVFGAAFGTRLVLILIGLAGPIVTFLLARESNLSLEWAVFCGVTVATSTLFQIQAFFPMSDVLTLVIACLVLLFLYRMDRDTWSGYLLGVCLALGVLTRPANILFFVPVGLHLMVQPRRLRQSWKIILGGLPGAAFQSWVNLSLYDKILTTSYGDFSSLFKAEYFLPTLLFFMLNGLILVTPMALIGFLGSPTVIGSNRFRLLPLFAQAVSFICFYAFYFHSSEVWWTLRFILPVFPAVIILAAHFWSRLLPRIRNSDMWSHVTRWAPIGFAVAAIIVGQLFSNEKRIYSIHTWENGYREAAEWLGERTEETDVVLCMQVSGAFFYYLPNPIIRWDYLKPEVWESEVAPSLLQNRRVFAALFPFEVLDRDVFETRIPGDWKLIKEIMHVSIYELVPP
jgi:hypothetical protein